jgi:hypothetical protein
VGLCLGAVAVAILVAPGQEHLTAPGRMNTGHQVLACEGCHRPAPGTLRQQLQANARFLLGWRKAPADFGVKAVEDEDCSACHERPFDRHPAFRFSEPRFEEARRLLRPQHCHSCHREHSGSRVTVQPGYCVLCHATLQLDDDPLDVPHATLVREGRWLSCLGCHDFHGNHLMESPTRLNDAVSADHVARYFQGGASPYPPKLRQPSRRKRVDLDH